MRKSVLLIAILAACPALAATPTPDNIDNVTYDSGPLPDGQSALAVKTQVLLDRAGISPGVIDGRKGGMTTSAIKAFERREGLDVDGALDAQVWSALGGEAAGEIMSEYTISASDINDLTPDLTRDYEKMAEREILGFRSASEALAEKFHMDEDFLKALNAGASFEEGETIWVVAESAPLDGSVSRIEIDASSGRLTAFGEGDAILASYPVAIGSTETPSPSGQHTVRAVAPNPTYTYRPDVNFQQGDNAEALVLPPGPNGPVGSTWIDLSKDTYGIHGTPDPAKLFVEQSHGCVRMTNWDAAELAEMVSEGVDVRFME